MVLTMAAVAENKGISPSHLAAKVEGHTEFIRREATTRFVSQLEIGEGLTSREKSILYNSARTCEVHKMLRGEITFEEDLSFSAGGTGQKGGSHDVLPSG